jgi:pimeloyl-ACP methyl ester carboxylesterase
LSIEEVPMTPSAHVVPSNAGVEGPNPDAWSWRSPLLGDAATVSTAVGEIEYFDRGTGPTIVFAHGWMANANLWRAVVDALVKDFRCVALDLPLGAHRRAVDIGAGLGPDRCGALIAEILQALDLEGVTLVGNDSGGAYSQIAAAAHPARLDRLVLNSCETPFDQFPPPPFDGLPAIAADTRTLKELLSALREPGTWLVPEAYGLLIKHPAHVEWAVRSSYMLPCLIDEGILANTASVMHSADSAPVHRAGERLISEFEKPVCFVWSPEDRVFPVANAYRYAEQLRDGRVELIDDAFSFTPEDQPVLLASAIGRFVSSD